MGTNKTNLTQAVPSWVITKYSPEVENPGPNYWAWIYTSNLWGVSAIYYPDKIYERRAKHRKYTILFEKRKDKTSITFLHDGKLPSTEFRDNKSMEISFKKISQALKTRSWETFCYLDIQKQLLQTQCLGPSGYIFSLTTYKFKDLKHAYETICT